MGTVLLASKLTWTLSLVAFRSMNGRHIWRYGGSGW